MVHNPGGHWNPVRVPHPRCIFINDGVVFFLVFVKGPKISTELLQS